MTALAIAAAHTKDVEAVSFYMREQLRPKPKGTTQGVTSIEHSTAPRS
ncbi:MAG: hypothetical protein AAB343_04135 [Patescibacteria group bacterium]